jgi:hypothetical protein
MVPLFGAVANCALIKFELVTPLIVTVELERIAKALAAALLLLSYISSVALEGLTITTSEQLKPESLANEELVTTWLNDAH